MSIKSSKAASISDFPDGLLDLDSAGTDDVNDLSSFFVSAGLPDAADTPVTESFPSLGVGSCGLAFGFVDFSDVGCSLDLETAFSL